VSREKSNSGVSESGMSKGAAVHATVHAAFLVPKQSGKGQGDDTMLQRQAHLLSSGQGHSPGWPAINQAAAHERDERKRACVRTHLQPVQSWAVVQLCCRECYVLLLCKRAAQQHLASDAWLSNERRTRQPQAPEIRYVRYVRYDRYVRCDRCYGISHHGKVC